MMRESLGALQQTFSRRALFGRLVKGASLVAVYDRFGPSLFGSQNKKEAQDISLQVYGAIGRIVIPRRLKASSPMVCISNCGVAPK